MPLRVGWHLAVWVLSIGITSERHMKSPNPDLYRGASSDVWSYGVVLAPADSHLCTVIQTPLRS
jgi:hypothetical protein